MNRWFKTPGVSMTDPILKLLRRSATTAARLWDLCDFELVEEDAPGWFALASGETPRVIGRDGTGGRFFLHRAACGPEALWYVSSEGQAGVIADSLPAGVQMMVALPYWRDCLKFSGGGDLAQMRKAQAYLEADLLKRRTDLDALRRKLYRAFYLDPPAAEALHRAVAAGADTHVVAASDGNPFESLFNTFVRRG
jgi:hypothetical protein